MAKNISNEVVEYWRKYIKERLGIKTKKVANYINMSAEIEELFLELIKKDGGKISIFCVADFPYYCYEIRDGNNMIDFVTA